MGRCYTILYTDVVHQQLTRENSQNSVFYYCPANNCGEDDSRIVLFKHGFHSDNVNPCQRSTIKWKKWWQIILCRPLNVASGNQIWVLLQHQQNIQKQARWKKPTLLPSPFTFHTPYPCFTNSGTFEDRYWYEHIMRVWTRKLKRRRKAQVRCDDWNDGNLRLMTSVKNWLS